jgi:hypothetical protein
MWSVARSVVRTSLWLLLATGVACGESADEGADTGIGGSFAHAGAQQAGGDGSGGQPAMGGSAGKGGRAGSGATGGASGGTDEPAGASATAGSEDGSAGGSGGEGGSLGMPDEIGECNDGVDNDGDGLTDWHTDLGCYGAADGTEAALPRDEEDGFTTFEIGADSVVVYVSADGDDGASGTLDEPVQTLARAAELVRDGENDFILLKRGDTFRDQTLGRFKSGRDAEHPLVVASYGDSRELPRIEISEYFINHDGQTRSFVAILDLHLVVSTRDPNDPDFDGGVGGEGLFRYVGGGSRLLIEGCHLEYGEIVVQSYDAVHYEDVEIRRNVVEKSYHANTCLPGDPNGDSTYRPSGLYSSHVVRLSVEGNLFDHNGWNEDVPTACATIYNHNLYVNGTDLVVRDNLLARASSIHIKLRSDTTSDMTGLTIENNHFVEGEIGVSIGGNSEEPYRFVASTIRDNVLCDIGRSQPTTRTLAWGVDVQDNDGLLVEDNLFLNQREPGVGNSYALNLAGGSERDVTVRNNLFYRIQGRSLAARPEAEHQTIGVSDNTFVDPDQGACLIDHEGAFSGYSYAGNRYSASAAPDSWFCLDGSRASLEAWNQASGDTGSLADPSFPDPDRAIESYAASLGLGSTLADFLGRARRMSRLEYDSRLAAPAVNDYIRAGFGR